MNPSSAQAGVVVDELLRHGVRDVVLAPGSRSAPLAYALVDAEAAGRVRLHVRVDERSAGFLALGLAKATGVPVPVVTTSGTAVANLHPAVLEAHHAHVPLVVLSADRPPELRGTGANQTTVQPGIFGAATRLAVDLGVAADRPGEAAAWRGAVSRVVAAALGSLGGDAGPVQLNLPFRDPLAPDGTSTWCESLDGRADGAPWSALPQARGTDAEPLPDEPRTVVVLGDLPDPASTRLACEKAAAAGWPVISEPFGSVGPTVLPHGPLLLTTSWWRSRAPRRALVVGRPTLSRPVADLLRHPEVRVEAVTASTSWPDPGHRAAVVHPWAALAAHVPGARTQEDAGWSSDWAGAGARLATGVATLLEVGTTGLAVARTVATSVPSGTTLFVGPSNPVRDLDLAAPRRADVTVRANRGLAGIDGCVSTAYGLALGLDAPVVALMGDLTFLHDANGLLVGPGEPTPDLTVVVPNDDGGGIFTTLEHGAPERARTFERVFGTPTGTRLADLCRAHGVAHELAPTLDDLATSLRVPHEGVRVVEVPLDRSRHREAHERLRAAAAEALA